MRARTAVIVFVAGAVLTFAVSSHPAAIDVRTAGIILMITGAIGLWPSGGKAWLLLGRVRLHQFVDEVAPVQGPRVPFGELMDGGPQAAAAGANVCAPPAGHEQLMQVPADLPEVTRDDEDREPAQADQGQ
jgi:hypothetical protein